MGGRITGRAQPAEICDETGWPALPPLQSASSTPVSRGIQPWAAAKGKVRNKPPPQINVELQNRYSPLLQSPGSSSGFLSSDTRVRTENISKSKRLQGKLKPGLETLIVGDFAVKDVQRMCGKNTEVLCFPRDMISDLAERILHIVAEHPTVKNVILHIWSNDGTKQQSKVLKQDFTGLLRMVSPLDVDMFISSPIPPVRRAEERFSRLLALNNWLTTACNAHSVNFINNFNIFWERRHLFKADGFCLNMSGVKLCTSNLYSLPQPSVLPAKDKRQKKTAFKKAKHSVMETFVKNHVCQYLRMDLKRRDIQTKRRGLHPPSTPSPTPTPLKSHRPCPLKPRSDHHLPP
uniref:Uncharacterized protein n=1 Tax=Labrus bergylta TaxID=56723 RepID=A0A3Q3FN22_9LABR